MLRLPLRHLQECTYHHVFKSYLHVRNRLWTCVQAPIYMCATVCRHVRRLLSTCAQLIAVLPFKNADEPLTALASMSAIISRRGDAARDALRAALECLPGSQGTNGASATEQSPPGAGNDSNMASPVAAHANSGAKGTSNPGSAAQQVGFRCCPRICRTRRHSHTHHLRLKKPLAQYVNIVTSNPCLWFQRNVVM